MSKVVWYKQSSSTKEKKKKEEEETKKHLKKGMERGIKNCMEKKKEKM